MVAYPSISNENFGRLFIGGHSFAAGYQNLEGAERYASRLALALGAEEVTYAITGAVLAQDNSSTNPGGYPSVLNGIYPRVTSGFSYSPRKAAPYLATSPVNVFNYGSNDLAFLTATTATNVAWVKMALRALTCLARAGGYFPDTDGSVAYGGSGGSHWTANTGQVNFGSPTNHSTTTTGDTVTITVPADYPGGEVDLLTLASSGGARWSTTVDGGAAQVLDGTGSAFGANSGRTNLVVQRLTGLSPGSHTIVMTLASKDSAATAVFDSWLIGAPGIPLVILCNEPLVPALPQATGGIHDPLTVADTIALNTAIAALPAEFADGRVLLGDIQGYFAAAGGNVSLSAPGSLVTTTGDHPNSAGHAVIAQCLLDTVRKAPDIGNVRFSPAGRILRQIGAAGAAGTEPVLRTNWSAPGSPGTAYFSKGPGGQVEVNIQGQCANASASTVLTRLPPGYYPSSEVFFTAVSWASGFVSASPGLVSARADGTINWYDGDASTLLQVFGSWYAGGPGQ